MNKKGLFARIDSELLFRFKRFVIDKYGKLNGSFSIEVQNAIAHWLNEQGLAAHTKTHINPGIPRIQNKIDSIIRWLRDNGYTNQFTLKDWEQATIHVVGSDPRTIKKYLNLARKLGRIKPYAGNVWEII